MDTETTRIGIVPTKSSKYILFQEHRCISSIRRRTKDSFIRGCMPYRINEHVGQVMGLNILISYWTSDTCIAGRRITKTI